MKGTLENNSSEDIKDCQLDLVVGGNPNLFFGNTLDPASAFMANGGPYIKQLITSGFTPNTYGGAVLDKYSLSNNAAPATLGFSNTYIPPADNTRVATEELEPEYDATGEKVNNFYYFDAGKVTVKRHGIAIVPVSSNTIPYKTTYDVDINDFTNYAVRRQVQYTEDMFNFDVYQSIKFTNKGTVPLTSASIFLVNEHDKPIAQDQVKYTPAGAEAFIRLQKAIDVLVKSKEDEDKRNDRDFTFRRTAYDRVTLKGTLEVQNYLDKAITLNVKKTVTGQNVDAKEGTFTSRKVQGNPNSVSSIKWEVALNAGEKKTLTYLYDVYVVSPPRSAK